MTNREGKEIRKKRRPRRKVNVPALKVTMSPGASVPFRRVFQSSPGLIIVSFAS